MRGDHYVTLVVQVPEHLSNEQKELLRQFDASLRGEAADTAHSNPSGGSGTEHKKKKSFMDKVKEAFED